MFLLSSLAPSAMPLDLSGIALSATAIRLSWSPPPADSQNGVIVAYEARFVSVQLAEYRHVSSHTFTDSHYVWPQPQSAVQLFCFSIHTSRERPIC